MSSLETSPIAGLRGRSSGLDAGTATVVLFLLGAAIFLLIGCLQSKNFAQLTVEGIALGSVYGSLALALVLVYRATHVINFAQGELAMLTTYIAYQLGLWGLSYWEAFAATLAIAFVLGTVLQVTLIRPVQHRSVIATVIVTVGLFILIDGVVNWIWGGDFKSMNSPFGNGLFDVGGVTVLHLYVGMTVVVLASVALVWTLFRFTKLGLGMRAAALRPAAAALVGIRVDSMLAIGWGLAALLGAVAGLMAEPSQIFLSSTFMQPILVYAFAAAVLGGLESPAGALVGGLLIGVTLTLLVGYQPHIGPITVTSELQVPFVFAVLLLVLLIKPSGLFGRREVRRV
jgi:branched-chain amino acid transport system permease protein